MRNKKIGTWIARLMITMLTFMGLGQTMMHAQAVVGNPTDVIITKVETSDAPKNMTIDQLTDGVGDIATYFTGGKAIKGVTFVYYSVTNAQLTTMKAAPAAYDTADAVETFVGAAGIETAETGANGQVTISGLVEGNYWVVENTEGTVASSAAVPFGLTLPFTNKAGTGYLERIYVYPKNTLIDDEPEIKKEVNESNVAIGQLNTWTISVDIPQGIESYDKFEVFDILDTRLDLVDINGVKVEAGGITLIKDTDYTIGLDGRKLEVKFLKAGRVKLATSTSDPKKLVITIETRVNSNAIMGQEIPNSATLVFDNGTGNAGSKVPGEIPEVHTGGKAFVKRNEATNVVLPGAEFKIKNPAGQFVNVGPTGIVTFGLETDATVFTSGANGKFEIKGLPYGNYVLVETKAPQGYALPTNPNVDFVVNATSFYSNPGAIGSGDNLANVEQFVNNRALVIPQTGGIGTVVFTVAGAVMMLFSALFYKRTKEA